MVLTLNTHKEDMCLEVNYTLEDCQSFEVQWPTRNWGGFYDHLRRDRMFTLLMNKIFVLEKTAIASVGFVNYTKYDI